MQNKQVELFLPPSWDKYPTCWQNFVLWLQSKDEVKWTNDENYIDEMYRIHLEPYHAIHKRHSSTSSGSVIFDHERHKTYFILKWGVNEISNDMAI